MKEFNSVYEELTALNESPISAGEYTLRLAFDIGITTAKELEEFKTAYKKEHPGCIDDLTTMLINYKKELGPNFQINSIMDEPINEGENLTEDAEEEPEIPESFEDKMDFLAADEQEAIDGYDLIIAALSDEDANVKEQLEKIKTEEIAHKEFLEKVKEDHDLVYTEPLEQEETEKE